MSLEKNEILIAEWKEIRETLRYFGNKRFAQLTVFIAATGFMVNYFFTQPNHLHSLLLQIMGSIFSLLFLIMEIRSVEYWEEFVARGIEIEDDPGFTFTPPAGVSTKFIRNAPQLMHRRPIKKGLKKALTGTWSTYFLYGIILLFWLTSFFWHRLHFRHWR